MYAPYRLFGGALSPYSRKVETYLRYKGLEHTVLERTAETAAEFARLAKLPLLPLLVDARGGALQDSTPMIEVLEERHPERGVTPEDAGVGFLSLLLEDFADEWLNKALYHYRWSFEPDARAAAQAIAGAVIGEAEAELRESAIEQICARMAERRALVGVSDAVAAVIEGSFRRTLLALEPVFAARPYLFGGRPACADFALAAQLEQMLLGPTAGALMRGEAPQVCAWVERMRAPGEAGDFLPFEAAVAALEPLLQEVAQVYLPWLQANALAHSARRERFELTLAGDEYAQAPQRYAASKAFPELRAKRQAAPQEGPLADLLQRLGVEAILTPPPRPRLPEPTIEADADDTAEAHAAPAEPVAALEGEGEPGVAAAAAEEPAPAAAQPEAEPPSVSPRRPARRRAAEVAEPAATDPAEPEAAEPESAEPESDPEA